MEFCIANTFTESIARLTGDEQQAVKTTAFDLQLNLANPGMSFYKLEKARDKNFWSIRVSNDIPLRSCNCCALSCALGALSLHKLIKNFVPQCDRG